jgi:hypothetical protein
MKIVFNLILLLAVMAAVVCFFVFAPIRAILAVLSIWLFFNSGGIKGISKKFDDMIFALAENEVREAKK